MTKTEKNWSTYHKSKDQGGEWEGGGGGGQEISVLIREGYKNYILPFLLSSYDNGFKEQIIITIDTISSSYFSSN